MPKENQKFEVDRSGRLAFVLAISGALYIIFTNIFKSYVDIFSTYVYTKDFFNDNYMLAVISISIAIIIFLSILKYIYLEMMTYRQLKYEYIKRITIEKADIAFENIIKNVISSLFIFSIFIGVIIIKSHVQTNGIVPVGVVGFSIIAALFILYKTEARTKSSIRKFALFFKDNVIGSQGSIIYVFLTTILISIVVGTTITLTSISSINQKAIVYIDDNNEIPININLQNFLDPLVTITISNINNIRNKEVLQLEQSINYSSYSEATINKKIVGKKEVQDLMMNIDQEVERFHFPKTRFINEYNINLQKYIEEGKYLIEITMLSQEDNGTKVTKFSTIIDKKSNGIKISEQNFESE